MPAHACQQSSFGVRDQKSLWTLMTSIRARKLFFENRRRERCMQYNTVQRTNAAMDGDLARVITITTQNHNAFSLYHNTFRSGTIKSYKDCLKPDCNKEESRQATTREGEQFSLTATATTRRILFHGSRPANRIPPWMMTTRL